MVVVLDRLYGNLSFPQQVLKAGGHFLIRYCTNTTFVPDPARPARESRDAKGTGSFKSGVGWARLRRLAVSTCVGSPSICVTAKRSVWSPGPPHLKCQ